METITVQDWTGDNVIVNRAEFHERWDDARMTDIKRLAIFANNVDQSVCDEIWHIEARLNEIKAQLVDAKFNKSLEKTK
jgi:hypothetical protein